MTLRRPPVVYLDNFIELTGDQIVVANLIPYPDEMDIGVIDHVVFDVLDLGTGTNEPSSVVVTINGVTAYSGGFQPPWHLGSTLTKSKSVGSAVDDIWHFVIKHDGFAWSSEELITVRVQAASTGAYSIDFTYEFTVADVIAPEVDSVVGASPRVVQVQFDEAMDPTTVTTTCFTLTSTDAPYYIPTLASVEQITASLYALHYEQELSNARDYSLLIDSVEDTSGNAIVEVVVPFTSAAYPAPDNRKWTLWNMVPARVRWADRLLTGSSPGHTEQFIAIIQEVVDLWLLDVDTDAYLYDKDRAPEGAIDLLLHYLGNPFKFVLTESEKRKLLDILPTVNASKHEPGLIDAIYFFMGITVTITKLNADGWRLATDGLAAWRLAEYGKLGSDTDTAPSGTARLLGLPGEAWPYTFIVHCPVDLTTDQRRKMIQIIEVMKNAHEHYTIEEPGLPPLPIWHLGYSKLGPETRLSKTIT